jgi:replication-associated recombination protein RarA
VSLRNPGTGKTTVARLYAKLLQQLGVLPEDSVFVETSGAKLSSKGTSELEKHLKEAKEAGGGVIFVDEAYQLVRF